MHFVTPELDAGPAILQYRVRIHPEQGEPELRARVQAGEYMIYPRVIGWIAAGRIRMQDDKVWLDDKPLDAPVIQDEST